MMKKTGVRLLSGILAAFLALSTLSFFLSSDTVKAAQHDDDEIVLRVCSWEEYIDLGGWEEDEVIDLESGDIFGENDMVSDFEDWDGESDYYPTLSSPRLETHKSRLQLGGMVRAGILYSQGRLTLSVDGQASTFNYKHSDNTVRLIDWYLNASVGYRF